MTFGGADQLRYSVKASLSGLLEGFEVGMTVSAAKAALNSAEPGDGRSSAVASEKERFLNGEVAMISGVRGWEEEPHCNGRRSEMA